MRVVFYIIVGLILVVSLLRRLRGARGSLARSALRRVARAVGKHHLLGDTGLVAGRELRERLRGRLFKVITLILLGVVAAAVVLPTVRSSSQPVVKIGVIGSLGPGQDRVIGAALEHVQLKATVTAERDTAAAQTALRNRQVTVVVDRGEALLVGSSLSSGSSTTTATAARAIAAALGIQKAFHDAGLSASQEGLVAGAKPLPIRSVATHQSGSAQGTSVIGLVFIFILLTQYLTWTLVGVMEEKTSRVVEVLLATVKPLQLLGGKVLGIGIVALLQAGLVVGFALALAAGVGSDILQGTAPVVVVASLVWLVLAYAFYSWVFAAAGSMAERQDQAQSLSLPLSVPIIVGYILALVNAGPHPASLLLKILAYLPPTAPFGMPLLVAKGEAAWWQFLLAALLSVASTVVVARFAAIVYQRAVLRTGRRLRVKEVVGGFQRS